MSTSGESGSERVIETSVDLDPSAHDAQPLPPLEEGTIIEGKYRIDRVIGRGGMGIVAAATHIDLGERVALKFLQVPETDTPDDFRARFALEARVCAKLRNEHIARVHDVGEWMGRVPFMVMELLDGVDLRRVLKHSRTLGIGRAVDLAVQICDGLAEAHAQGIVHRDLKPPNIFITKRSDGSELVKVLDFGISKWAEEVAELTKTGVMLGSPKYMAPEQLNGSIVDARADVWSIGAILYGMLTGRPPYDFANVAQTFLAIATGAPPPALTSLDSTIPPALEAVVLRCLVHGRSQRIQNVAELAGELLRAVDSPHAATAQAQIEAVLEPAAVSLRSCGPLSSTTGSYKTAFTLGTTGTAWPSVGPLPSTMPAPIPAKSPSRRWIFAGGAAAALAIAGIVGMGAHAATRAELRAAASPKSKSVAAKDLARQAPTSLVVARVAAAMPARVLAPHEDASRRGVTPAPTREETASASVAAPLPRPTPSAPSTAPAATVNPLEDRQ